MHCVHIFKAYNICLEVLSKVSVKWKTIISKIKISSVGFKTKSISGRNLKWSKVPLYSGGCQSLDLKHYFNLTGSDAPLDISFYLYKVENHGISIYIQERNKALKRRTLKSNLLSYSGPVIENRDLIEPILYKEIVSISQNLFSERDTLKKCRNYPNEDYESYRECDEHFVYQEMRSKYNLMPFWAANKLNEVSYQV